MITAGGIGSGLDVSSLISQLMSVERIPLQALQRKESGYQSQLSAYGQLKSALSTFQSALSDLKSLDDFKVFKATSADEDVFTASATSAAGVGTFNIRVNALAVQHKVGSAAQLDKDTTTFGNAGDTLTLTSNAESFTVNSGGLTLEGIRDAINNATDNVGVTASIVSESATSHRLVLTANEGGTANQISLAFEDSGGSPVTDPLTMAQIVAASNSSIQIDDTYTISRSTNTLDDVITGVTLNLKATSASNVNLQVSRDTDAVKETVKKFVDAYNTLRGTFDSLRNGQLKGDSGLRSVENQVRAIFNTPPTGLSSSYQYLSEVGVSFQKNGTLSLDNSKLETALNTDYDGVAALFANDDQGYMFRLDALVDDLLDTDSTIDAREGGINGSIKLVQGQISNMEYRLELIEKRYRTQYAALDAMLGQMQATSSFLSSQLLF